MTFTINNGHRALVEFGPYAGRAGVSEDGREVAFVAKLRDIRGVTTGSVDGVPHAVLRCDQSATVPAMVVLTVAAVAPDDSV